jgi:antitoxin component of RelBE/YafQ-DinJ toxin-antitoxin module
LYQLLNASQTELGQQFRLWFTGEVMPQLVRTGSYTIQPQLPPTSHDELQALQFEQLAAQAAAERQREAHLRVQTKLLRIELVLKAKQAAQELGLNTNQALDVAAQLAIDAAALPLNLSDEGFTDAGEYLRMRGHNESQVRSLQVTFGLMLKKHYQQVHGVAPPGHFHAEFGGVVKTPYSYNRQADRELLNGTYQMLTLTDTYRKQVPNALLALNSVA